MAKNSKKNNVNIKKSESLKKMNNYFHNRLLGGKFSFDDFMDDFFRIPSISNDNFFLSRDFNIPSMNLSETEDEYKVSVDLAGMDKKDIDISLKDGILFIDAEKSEEDSEEGENFYRQECSYGSYHRSVRMPKNIKIETINAKYKDGILKISIKKDEKLSSDSRKINIE